LIKSIKEIKHDDSKAISDRVGRILNMKNMAEYEERNIKPNEAAILYQNAEKILELVRERLI
jgi:hypothetical protein